MKFLIFSGTTEGKIIWEYLKKAGAEVSLFVATDYGAQVMPAESLCDVFVGRLNQDEMTGLFLKERPTAVIDATHPYAVEVTANIKAACMSADTQYIRFLRPSVKISGLLEFENVKSATAYLSSVTGKVLLTTGSKDLEEFTHVLDYKSRLFPRILPAVGAVERCLALGYDAGNIICMKGPFSAELNAAMIRSVGAEYIVTKDTGVSGGFAEKVEAARMTGAKVIVINRAKGDEGYDFEGVKQILADKFALQVQESAHEPPYGCVENQSNLELKPKYPFFIDLHGRKILVVGGGNVATRRIKSLMDYGAEIIVIAPVVTDFIKTAAESGKIKLIMELFDGGYLDNTFFMVITATDQKELNGAISQRGKALGVLSNDASDASSCDFFFPALFAGRGVLGGIVSEKGIDHKLTAKVAQILRDFLSETDKF